MRLFCPSRHPVRRNCRG